MLPLPYHNWRRPLPRPIILPDVPLTLSTLEDVRALVQRHLPAEYRAKDTWQRVACCGTQRVKVFFVHRSQPIVEFAFTQLKAATGHYPRPT